jgi:hypothetical protein
MAAGETPGLQEVEKQEVALPGAKQECAALKLCRKTHLPSSRRFRRAKMKASRDRELEAYSEEEENK